LLPRRLTFDVHVASRIVVLAHVDEIVSRIQMRWMVGRMRCESSLCRQSANATSMLDVYSLLLPWSTGSLADDVLRVVYR
jgi:hypothetical protein